MNDAGSLYAILAIIPSLAVYVWVGLSLSAVFAKAGEEGWKAWVPIWNTVVLLQLGGMSPWLILLALVPFLGWLALFVVLIMAYHRINTAFGLGVGMTVLAALLFPVWASLVGWGSPRWLGAEAAAPMRRSTAVPPLDARVGVPPVAGYGVPPRPPAPAAGPPHPYAGAAPAAPGYGTPPPPAFPPAPPAFPPAPPAPAGSASPVLHDAEDDDIIRVPAFRSSARAAAAAAAAGRAEDDGADRPDDQPDDGGIQLGRSHAPFTQTVPTTSTPADEIPPAAPRRAFAPEPGEAPSPIETFAPAAAPDGAPAVAPGFDVAAPVQSVPEPPAVQTPGDPWAPPHAPEPAIAARATRYSPLADVDAHFDTSAEVSAVAGAPTMGEPRSARESVSAQHNEREIPDGEGEFDETVLASRRRPTWVLTPPLGAPIAVTSDVLIIGRRPGADADFPDAQLIPVSDETRTMSKTHARLELRGDGWIIFDLDSTNGVILIREDGSESEAVPGVPESITGRFLLGDAELRLTKKESASRSGGADSE